MNTPSLLLTIRETASTLRVSVSTVHRMLARGDLPRIKVGYATRIARPDLERYVDAQRMGAA